MFSDVLSFQVSTKVRNKRFWVVQGKIWRFDSEMTLFFGRGKEKMKIVTNWHFGFYKHNKV